MRGAAAGFPPKRHPTGVRAPFATSTRSPTQRPPALESKSRYVVALPSGRAKWLITRGIDVPGSAGGIAPGLVKIGSAPIRLELASTDAPLERSTILVVDGSAGSGNATNCSSLDQLSGSFMKT